MSVTCSPRASSRQPIEDAARPLPRLETTPPVTKMYLGIETSVKEKSKKEKGKKCALFFGPHFLPFAFFLLPCFGSRFRGIIRLFFVIVNSAPEILLHFDGFLSGRIENSLQTLQTGRQQPGTLFSSLLKLFF